MKFDCIKILKALKSKEKAHTAKVQTAAMNHWGKAESPIKNWAKHLNRLFAKQNEGNPNGPKPHEKVLKLISDYKSEKKTSTYLSTLIGLAKISKSGNLKSWCMWSNKNFHLLPARVRMGTCWWWFSRQVLSDSLWPQGLQPARLLCPWDFPGKDTGVGCHFLLQGIFLTLGQNTHLLFGRQMLYHWATWEAQKLIQSPFKYSGII